MSLTVITATGDRPEAFALCELWMSRQTVRPDQWLVLDDGEVPTVCDMGQEVVRCEHFRGEGSMVKKVAYAVAQGLISGSAVAFVEDDDWYAPSYLQTQLARLGTAYDLIGEGCAVYYNVNGRWWYDNANMRHASLCQTILHRRVLDVLLRCCKDEDPFLDTRLWQAIPWGSRVFAPDDGCPTTVGIKGMPGRKGYGSGHRPNPRQAIQDPNLEKLYSLIGDDVEAYIPFFQHEG